MLIFSLSLCLASPEPPTKAVVSSVYDGDTFTLSDGSKIRLRGVNTPELRPMEDYGIEARDAVARLLINQTVQLSYGKVKQDSYGRYIASVQVKDVDIGTYLVENGLGHVFIIPPEKLNVPSLMAAQEKARKAQLGIWRTSRYQGDVHMTSFHANAPGNDNQNVNGEYIRLCNIRSKPVELKDYSIRNISGSFYKFPKMLLPPGHTVKIHSGKGRIKQNPKKQLEIYLQSNRPIWNNRHDRASIYNGEGQLQDSREHSPKTYRD